MDALAAERLIRLNCNNDRCRTDARLWDVTAVSALYTNATLDLDGSLNPPQVGRSFVASCSDDLDQTSVEDIESASIVPRMKVRHRRVLRIRDDTVAHTLVGRARALAAAG